MSVNIIKKLCLKLTDTKTSGATGNVEVPSAALYKTIISAIDVGGSTVILIPFQDENGRNYLKALKWNTSNYTVASNVSITYTITYIP